VDWHEGDRTAVRHFLQRTFKQLNRCVRQHDVESALTILDLKARFEYIGRVPFQGTDGFLGPCDIVCRRQTGSETFSAELLIDPPMLTLAHRVRSLGSIDLFGSISFV
jgi:hypothetical protein